MQRSVEQKHAPSRGQRKRRDPRVLARVFAGVLAALHALNYDGWIVVEQDVFPGQGSPAESARRNREFLASLGI